ncbi:MAG: contractile injection system tape measure protein [Bacteroidota bacterium]
MIKQNRHIIKRQILDLELPSERGAHQLQRKLSRLYQEEVLPKLEEVLQSLSLEGRVFQIPELRIDLGTLDLSQLDKEFTRRCVEALSRELKRRYEQANMAEGDDRFLSSTEHGLQSLIHFLEKGYLSPRAIPVQWEEMETHLSTALKEGDAQGIKQFRSSVRDNPLAFTRAIHHLSEEGIAELRRHSMVHVRQIRTHLLKKIQDVSPRKVPRVILRALDIHLFLIQKEILASPIPVILSACLDQWASLRLGTPILKYVRELQSRFSPTAKGESVGVVRTHASFERKGIPKTKQNQGIGGVPIASPLQPLLFQPKEPGAVQQLLEQAVGMQIQLAGIPIVAPYLPAFFTAVGLIKEKEWVSDEAKIHGMHLLYFLVTGKQQAEEYHLPLAKVLCAWPLEMPVPQNIQLSPSLIQEAEEVLQAIITHWTALKATTIDGLRETFLQRMGRLVRMEQPSGWLLQVERKSYDILLDRLPWTISSIKLPWMEEILRVEW